MVNTTLREMQGTYKAYHDERVGFKLTFAPGDDVFIERPPLIAVPAECLTTSGYVKLLPGRLRPCRIITVDQENVTLCQEKFKTQFPSTVQAPSPIDNNNDDISNEESRARHERRPPEQRQDREKE